MCTYIYMDIILCIYTIYIIYNTYIYIYNLYVYICIGNSSGPYRSLRRSSWSCGMARELQTMKSCSKRGLLGPNTSLESLRLTKVPWSPYTLQQFFGVRTPYNSSLASLHHTKVPGSVTPYKSSLESFKPSLECFESSLALKSSLESFKKVPWSP